MLTMFAEVKQDGKWHKVAKQFESTFEELDGQLTDRVFDGHDKPLVSFLTAQSHGGLPEDVSEDIRVHKYFQNNEICHATLAEVLAFEWDKVIYKTGYISRWQYERIKKNGISPVSIVDNAASIKMPIVEPFHADLMIEYPVLQKFNKFYVVYKYDHKRVCELHEFFCKVSVPGLVKLIPDGGTANDVRIVFSV